MNIEHKFTIREIKQGVKGITKELLMKLINNPGCQYNTRHAVWVAIQIEPPYNIFEIRRWCVESDFHAGFKYYGTYIDETGIDEDIIIHCDEITL